jgi:hypothetical protein
MSDWKTHPEDWRLVLRKDTDKTMYYIINIKRGTALSFEDKDIYLSTVQQMILNGIQIISEEEMLRLGCKYK